jgi:hypothetical protein
MLLRRVFRRLASSSKPKNADQYTLPGEKFIVLADTQKKGEQKEPVFFVQEQEDPIDYDNVSFGKCKTATCEK